ncbi:MAG TPA: bifunctional riboflavin kinase/FAD synthetase [Oculatellaceae cyanobacterium]|jgi:riboflavin kinase/FMN adenylyltransferase
MKIYRSVQEVSLPASACAIGMFDGIHVGHLMVLESALREARIRGIPSVVVSFSNHPQFLISQTPTQLLSTLDERLAAFDKLGFEHALILDFDEWLKNLDAEAFIDLILCQHLGVRSVTIGYDHRFGKNRAGDGEMLKQVGLRKGFDVQIIEPVRTILDSAEGGGQIVSSTLIRKLLTYGELAQANQLLGYPYHLSGTVEKGMQRGRKLGFPTANLAVAPYRLIPANGTYGGYAELGGKRYPAVCNIGLCPTFGDQTAKKVEVHLLGYTGPDFYGASLKMTFTHKIRDEQKFPSVDALIAQIRQDCAFVQAQQQQNGLMLG